MNMEITIKLTYDRSLPQFLRPVISECLSRYINGVPVTVYGNEFTARWMMSDFETSTLEGLTRVIRGNLEEHPDLRTLGNASLVITACASVAVTCSHGR